MDNTNNNNNGAFSLSEEGRRAVEAAVNALGEACKTYGAPLFCVTGFAKVVDNEGEKFELFGLSGYPGGPESTADEFFAMELLRREGLVPAAAKIAMLAMRRTMIGRSETHSLEGDGIGFGIGRPAYNQRPA